MDQQETQHLTCLTPLSSSKVYSAHGVGGQIQEETGSCGYNPKWKSGLPLPNCYYGYLMALKKSCSF